MLILILSVWNRTYDFILCDVCSFQLTNVRALWEQNFYMQSVPMQDLNFLKDPLQVIHFTCLTEPLMLILFCNSISHLLHTESKMDSECPWLHGFLNNKIITDELL